MKSLQNLQNANTIACRPTSILSQISDLLFILGPHFKWDKLSMEHITYNIGYKGSKYMGPECFTFL